MTQTLLDILLWFCALGCGLLGGLYFAFSAFIMRAFERIEPARGVAAMNSINIEILRSVFMPFFFGTTLGAAVLAVVGATQAAEVAGLCMLAGGIVYVAGMFIVTMLRNVPLNNLLAVSGTTGDVDTATWTRYLRSWTRWNHVRTLTSVAASALFIAAIAHR
jgi:uncharacterized membrane protein